MSQLMVIPVNNPDGNKLEEAYEVAADLTWKKGAITLRVPKFFQYDGAGVPAAAWQLIGSPFSPRFMLPSLLHDWLYHTHAVKQRRIADRLFYELLIENGVSKVKAWLMRSAVEAAGKDYWTNDADDLAYLRGLAKRIADDGRDPRQYGLA